MADRLQSADQLGTRQRGSESTSWAWLGQLRAGFQLVVDLDVQCGSDGLQIGAHVASMVIVALATSIMEALARFRRPAPESLV
jgi:hypothetical protein